VVRFEEVKDIHYYGEELREKLRKSLVDDNTDLVAFSCVLRSDSDDVCDEDSVDFSDDSDGVLSIEMGLIEEVAVVNVDFTRDEIYGQEAEKTKEN